MKNNLIVILGSTASGKTRLASLLARDLGAEIISADSRQVYRGMDLGTGKDLHDYLVDGFSVPRHLIDIVDPPYEFSVFDYQRLFFRCFSEIWARNVLPVMVGGTGLYIDAVLNSYSMRKVPVNYALRSELEREDMELLKKRLRSLNPALHNTTDIRDKGRLIRAIEIALASQDQCQAESDFPVLNPLLIGLRWERAVIRQRITERLRERLEAGMVEEVRSLHEGGIGWERLDSFGLEYRYIGLYLQGRLDYREMVGQLNARIHQFAKRQETWFRRMERRGAQINWLADPDYEKLKSLVERLL